MSRTYPTYSVIEEGVGGSSNFPDIDQSSVQDSEDWGRRVEMAFNFYQDDISFGTIESDGEYHFSPSPDSSVDMDDRHKCEEEEEENESHVVPESKSYDYNVMVS